MAGPVTELPSWSHRLPAIVPLGLAAATLAAEPSPRNVIVLPAGGVIVYEKPVPLASDGPLLVATTM